MLESYDFRVESSPFSPMTTVISELPNMMEPYETVYGCDMKYATVLTEYIRNLLLAAIYINHAQLFEITF